MLHQEIWSFLSIKFGAIPVSLYSVIINVKNMQTRLVLAFSYTEKKIVFYQACTCSK